MPPCQPVLLALLLGRPRVPLPLPLVPLLRICACASRGGPRRDHRITEQFPGEVRRRRGAGSPSVRGSALWQMTGDPVTGDPVTGSPVTGDPVTGSPAMG